MDFLLLIAIVAVLGVSLFALQARRRGLAELERRLAERSDARARGSATARLQVPFVDLSRCIGCGTCVRACPEDGVLDVVHGQAVVVHGARCVGHGRCAEECPVGAIAVTLADVAQRTDLPALAAEFAVPAVPGLFLAGEVTGFALVRTAIEHGVVVARAAAHRAREVESNDGDILDLCIVGAGPAGIACALEAKRLGLTFLLMEREELGGTVAKYPRRKLVMTQPVELPLHGRLTRTSFEREELLALWGDLVRTHELPLRTNEEFVDLEREGDEVLRLSFAGGAVVRTRSACLALGRRGKPRKLGVPGEELSKVVYGLVDARSYSGRRVLVVGGGDSAVEAALGLCEQPGNEVLLSYRGRDFTRVKARNEQRLARAVADRRLEVRTESNVQRITAGSVVLGLGRDGATQERANDDVFVLAGGIPPFELLARCGVSFDPADRPAAEPLIERGTGLVRALAIAFVSALVALALAVVFREYYAGTPAARAAHPAHELLAPNRRLGLLAGLAAAAAMIANLAYLLRRSPRAPLRFGSLTTWMTVHVATGIGALLFAVVHAGLVPRDTVGGHALLGLVVLVVTGAIGRYLYSFVPRAANGRELALDEVRARLASLSQAWDGQRGFGERVRERFDALADERWRSSFPRRLLALVGGQRHRARVLRELSADARAAGVADEDAARILALAREAHRAALAAAHFEDLRGLLATWRWLHRWMALFVVLVVVLHVRTAIRYAALEWPSLFAWMKEALP